MTNIENFQSTGPRVGTLVLAFYLGAVGVSAFPLMMQDRPACWYEGKAYSLGAVAIMAVDLQMACTVVAGEPAWTRDKTR